MDWILQNHVFFSLFFQKRNRSESQACLRWLLLDVCGRLSSRLHALIFCFSLIKGGRADTARKLRINLFVNKTCTIVVVPYRLYMWPIAGLVFFKRVLRILIFFWGTFCGIFFSDPGDARSPVAAAIHRSPSPDLRRSSALLIVGRGWCRRGGDVALLQLPLPLPLPQLPPLLQP